jgi:DNA-binding CsgD family transcriptional regulator
LYRDLGIRSGVVWNLDLLANLALARADARHAARLFGAAASLRELTGMPVQRAVRAGWERSIAATRATLGDVSFQRLWDEGRALSLDDAITYALGAPTDTISPRSSRMSHSAGLTAREVDVLRLVAQGLTDAEVAERLFMARRTVNTHLTSIYTKLGVNSRAAATRFAVEHDVT